MRSPQTSLTIQMYNALKQLSRCQGDIVWGQMRQFEGLEVLLKCQLVDWLISCFVDKLIKVRTQSFFNSIVLYYWSNILVNLVNPVIPINQLTNQPINLGFSEVR